ncbi:hypothetical protein BsWGS_04927 [Bradybaena similaris]
MASQEQCRLPAELDSDQQAAVLYSPFREMSLNPQSWMRKMKFWERLLLETALERRMVTVDVASLSLMFERKGIRPKCLGTVIEEMKKSGQIQSVEQYRRPHSWLSWGFHKLLKQPLAWGVGQLFGTATSDTEVFVWPAVVKLCHEVIQLYRSNVQDLLGDSLVSLAQLRSMCQTVIPSDADFQIVLSQLEREHQITVLETKDKELVIQFCKRGEISASPITEVDVQIYQIRLTESRLEKDIEALSLAADRLLNDARAHVREGSKIMAKHCLRKKRVLEATMDHRYACLSKLQDILQTIQDADTNEMVVKACAAGASIMRNVHQQLNVEGVEAVMDAVKDAIEVEEEIKQAMSSRLDGEDSDELERDLQELLATSVGGDQADDKAQLRFTEKDPKLKDVAAEAGTQEEKQHTFQSLLQPLTLDDLELPDVPSHSPYSSRQQTSHTAGPSRQQTSHTAGPSRQQTSHTAGPSRQQLSS